MDVLFPPMAGDSGARNRTRCVGGMARVIWGDAMAESARTLCLLAAVGFSPLALHAQDDALGTWTPRDTTGAQIYSNGGSATNGSFFYTLSGTANPSGIYKVCRRLDPVTNAWSDLPEFPVTMNWTWGTYHDGYLYGFGNPTPTQM